MSTISKSSQKRKSDARRQSLIDSTLRVIAREGVAAATVRTISREANVTQGLIRYYFQSKDDLIIAAYEDYMDRMLKISGRATKGADTAKCRLIRYVEASLTAPVSNRQQAATWAGFFQILLHDGHLLKQHAKTYHDLRQQTKTLMADVFEEEGRAKSDSELRRLSIAGRALLDGLWIEGGAIGDSFHPGELLRVGLEGLGALMDVDLKAYRDTKAGCGVV
ncbi:TetR/AcrR family transcriptional regulator [Cognatishimia sp.]|uniref:TetR/AcrR family transcriptional regulator n=1 Tax=Cognatishimia sp. TaxID=2211648 RepID=UPI003517ABB0